MSASTDRIKRYVGVAGDAIADVWQRLRAEPGEPAPIGGPATTPTAAPAVAGISTGTILLIVIAWFFLKGRKRG
ncbi:MAG: hypothetical protein HWN68_16635 [Desulfobacterales bacterium]|nr:hypothetical protein [Desulfobacterales bacterium]